MKIVKIICAILIPPVAAALQVGFSTHFWINLILTLLGDIPGIIYALWLVLTDKTAWGVSKHETEKESPCVAEGEEARHRRGFECGNQVHGHYIIRPNVNQARPENFTGCIRHAITADGIG